MIIQNKIESEAIMYVRKVLRSSKSQINVVSITYSTVKKIFIFGRRELYHVKSNSEHKIFYASSVLRFIS